MHIGQIITADDANGTGMRVSIFVSGCTNHCKGCFQPETWDFHYGREYTKEIEAFILEELAKPYYSGLTILGGEPFELENQETVCKLIKQVKETLPEKTIWVFTGFIFEKDLRPGGRRYGTFTDEILQNTDILVDGPYTEDQYSLRLKFRGSKNQRIIDIKETLKTGEIVLSALNN